MHPAPTVRFNLTALMRRHHVTLRELKQCTGITLKRIRAVRALTSVDYGVYCDFHQAVTGENIFSLARYRAIERQKEENLTRHNVR
jgi:hypothetical protein